MHCSMQVATTMILTSGDRQVKGSNSKINWYITYTWRGVFFFLFFICTMNPILNRRTNVVVVVGVL